MATPIRPMKPQRPFRSRIALLAVAGVWLAGASRAGASHSVFDFQVDRVAIDGNVFGPFDGVADRVDEFDDGALGTWVVVNGTVMLWMARTPDQRTDPQNIFPDAKSAVAAMNYYTLHDHAYYRAY